MGKPSAPDAPDPKDTGAAQTGTNVGTAIANTMMGFVDQHTPYGNLKYKETGSYTYKDPYTGEKYEIPQFKAVTQLNNKQKELRNINLGTQKNLATLAKDQSSRLSELLGSPFTLDGAPAGGDASTLNMPQYTQYAAAPELATSFADAGNIRDNIANAGQIDRTFADAGDITNKIEDAGDITKTYGANDFSADRTKVEEALMARMQPYLDKQRAGLETRLANQGVRLGSDAYSSAQYDHGRQVNDAVLANIIAGGQEQSRLVGMDRDRAMFQNAAQNQQYTQNANDSAFANAAQAQNFGQLFNRAQFSNAAQQQQYGQNANDALFANQAQQQRYGQLLGRAQFGNNATQQNFQNDMSVTGANNSLADSTFNAEIARLNAQNTDRQRYIDEQFALRNQPINEITALLGGSQVKDPTWANSEVSTIPTTDYAGIINQDFQNQMALYQQQQASLGGLMGGIGSIFGALSDERAKKDIKPTGKLMGHNIYEFRYKGQGNGTPKTVGVMAQEVERKRPDAVTTGPDGLKRVNYGLLFRKAA